LWYLHNIEFRICKTQNIRKNRKKHFENIYKEKLEKLKKMETIGSSQEPIQSVYSPYLRPWPFLSLLRYTLHTLTKTEKGIILWSVIEKCHSDTTHKYSEVEIKKMVKFFIDFIFVLVDDHIFQQSVWNLIGTNYAPRLEDLFNIHTKRNVFKSFYIKKPIQFFGVAFIRCFDLQVWLY
jgi:hypothetical protein